MGASQSRCPVARRNDSKHMSIDTTSRQDMISNDNHNYLNSDDGKEVKKRYSSIQRFDKPKFNPKP